MDKRAAFLSLNFNPYMVPMHSIKDMIQVTLEQLMRAEEMRKEKIDQNAQYTFKYNLSLGRHGWLRLTPAYSVRLVEEILAGLKDPPQCVMEPFSGTGTTELVCANKRILSFALEINPFLVWLGNAKLRVYSLEKIERFLHSARDLMLEIDSFTPAALPPIYNIHRWWGGDSKRIF